MLVPRRVFSEFPKQAMSDMPSSILAPELIDLLRHSLEHRKLVAGSVDVVVDTNTIQYPT